MVVLAKLVVYVILVFETYLGIYSSSSFGKSNFVNEGLNKSISFSFQTLWKIAKFFFCYHHGELTERFMN